MVFRRDQSWLPINWNPVVDIDKDSSCFQNYSNQLNITDIYFDSKGKYAFIKFGF